LLSLSLSITIPNAPGRNTGFSVRRRIQRSENRVRDSRRRPRHGSAGAPPGFAAGVLLSVQGRGIRVVGPQRRLRAQGIDQGQFKFHQPQPQPWHELQQQLPALLSQFQVQGFQHHWLT